MQPGAASSLFRSQPALHLLAVLWGLLLLWWDPIGLSSASEQALADFYLSSSAGIYPDERRTSTAVILTTDSDLESLGITWPVSHRHHDQFLYAIGRAKPKSVFVDVFFLDDRVPTEAVRLQERLRWLSCQTALYLMVPPDEARTGLSNSWAQFYSSSSEVVGECSIRLVNSSASTIDQSYAYPSTAPNAGLRSPAEQVFFDFGPNEDINLEPWHDTRAWQITWSLPSKRSCDKIASSHLLSEKSSDACETLERNLIVRAGRHILNAVSGDRFPHLKNDLSIQDVSPVPIYGVAELANRNSSAFSALRDSHVVYAVNVVGAEDTVEAPVYQAGQSRAIPAGLAHAMAIDNLFAYQGIPKGYLRSPQLKYIFGAAAILLGAALFSILSATISWRRRIMLLSLLVSVAMLVPLNLVYGELFRLAAINWISIPLVYFAAMSSLAPIFRKA